MRSVVGQMDGRVLSGSAAVGSAKKSKRPGVTGSGAPTLLAWRGIVAGQLGSWTVVIPGSELIWAVPVALRWRGNWVGALRTICASLARDALGSGVAVKCGTRWLMLWGADNCGRESTVV